MIHDCNPAGHGGHAPVVHEAVLACYGTRINQWHHLCRFLSSAARRSAADRASALGSTAAPELMTMMSPLSPAKSLSASSACPWPRTHTSH